MNDNNRADTPADDELARVRAECDRLFYADPSDHQPTGPVGVAWCEVCFQNWPCPVAALIAERDDLRGRAAAGDTTRQLLDAIERHKSDTEMLHGRHGPADKRLYAKAAQVRSLTAAAAVDGLAAAPDPPVMHPLCDCPRKTMGGGAMLSAHATGSMALFVDDPQPTDLSAPVESSREQTDRCPTCGSTPNPRNPRTYRPVGSWCEDDLRKVSGCPDPWHGSVPVGQQGDENEKI